MRQRYLTEEAKSELFGRSQVIYHGVRQMADELRPAFVERLWDSGPTNVAIATQGIVAHSMEWAGATAACYAAGYKHAADGMIRVSLENFCNLMYILYAGPAIEGRTREDLAGQYLAHGDAEHLKLLNKRGGAMRERIVGTGRLANRPFTADEFDALKERVKAKVELHIRTFEHVLHKNAKGEAHFGKRWHKTGFEEMISLVLAHLPAWFEKDETLQTLINAVTTWNTNLHASAFNFTRDRDRLDKDSLLVYRLGEQPNSGHAAAIIAYNSWLAMADMFGDIEQVTTIVKKNWDCLAEPIIAKHTKPAMWRIDTD